MPICGRKNQGDFAPLPDESYGFCKRPLGCFAPAFDESVFACIMIHCLPPPARLRACLASLPLYGGLLIQPPPALAQTSFKDCATCPEMVGIPAGQFVMGSPASEADHRADESPEHPVTISRSFAAGKTPVTFEQWDACVTDGGCTAFHPADQGWGRGNQPVINVSWQNAQSYVSWLNDKLQKAGKITAGGNGPYRLLSEAEWEYAARAGTSTRFYWGDEIGIGNANCGGCGSAWDGQKTAPVGSFAANAFGLSDMAGNVWQWVEDCYADSYANAPSDGSAAIGSKFCSHVLRGGSWYFFPNFVRPAARFKDTSGLRYIYVGFRVAKTLP